MLAAEQAMNSKPDESLPDNAAPSRATTIWRRAKIALAFTIAFGALYVQWWYLFLPMQKGWDPVTFHRIKIGMEITEVRSILGPETRYDWLPATYVWKRPGGDIVVCTQGLRPDDRERVAEAYLGDSIDPRKFFILPNKRSDDDPFWRIRLMWRQWFPGK